MPIEQDVGVIRKRKALNTYGRATKKRVPKPTFMPLTASTSGSEEEHVDASRMAVAHRRPATVPSAKPEIRVASPPARLKRSNEGQDAQISVASSSDRRRKVAQLHTSRRPKQPAAPASESEGEDRPAAPVPRRSRLTQPERRSKSTAKPAKKERADNETTPADSMRREVNPRLSSPPLTPTPPKVSREPIGLPRTSKGVSADVTSSKSAQPKTAQQQQKIPLHHMESPQPTRVVKKQTQFAPVEKIKGSSSAARPRKRLIDALAKQDSGDASDLGEDLSDDPYKDTGTAADESSGGIASQHLVLPATPKPKARAAPSTGARTFVRSNSALKFTYGQGRKVLEEEDNLLESFALPAESSYTRRNLDPEGPKMSFGPGTLGFDEGDAVNHSPSSKLRDIHELRQAGANSRVADAMQDLVDQIGKPGTGSPSSRRAALLQVAEKMHDKTFIRQCRNHGVESALLANLGEESDHISGYLLLSSLVTILAKDPSAHIGQLLRAEEPGPLFARLLAISDDIRKVVKDRKSNLSKRSQSSIITLESLLRELPIWDGHPPSYISPRGLAIKCLQILIGQDILIDMDSTVFTEAVTARLFQVISDAGVDAACWDYPTTAQSIELHGALSVLDFHAVSMSAVRGGNGEWAGPYLSIIADAFNTTLRMPLDNKKGVEGLLLKLTINITNNNLSAPDIFASKGVLPVLAASICSSFDRALALISQGSWAEGVLDGLLLRLGILINFAEHSTPVRQVVNDCQYGNPQPVDELIRLFIENHRRTGEADSMEKTHLNVALGYLAVLLGYLALYGPVRQKFVRKHSARSIGPLIGSIREFIAHYEQVETALSGDDDETHSHGTYLQQLQELVQQLEHAAVHD
ncbi:hypothetical protein F5Y17DRAFT_411522 [Xylariaceae sp. FL0594]|nr:hypothetical protein F5Y17DRAFT_411522 [Xylariaceae sp. FL0594]